MYELMEYNYASYRKNASLGDMVGKVGLTLSVKMTPHFHSWYCQSTLYKLKQKATVVWYDLYVMLQKPTSKGNIMHNKQNNE